MASDPHGARVTRQTPDRDRKPQFPSPRRNRRMIAVLARLAPSWNKDGEFAFQHSNKRHG